MSPDQAKKIRIKIIRKVVRGKVTVNMEFLDPCDMITQIRYYVDKNPFHNHNFAEKIPNPHTREIAEENEDYMDRTLEDWGMWQLDE